MTAIYRCCCGGEPAQCCRVWCNCSDTITISTCKRYTEKTAYACDMANLQICPIADGTIIGQRYSAWRINNLKLQRVTGALNLCQNCCYYQAVTGEEQTGTLEVWDETWFVNCYEKDGEECHINYKTCDGYMLGPLSGTSGTWTLNDFSATLHTECCDPSSCNGQSIRAILNIRAGGSRSNATETTDCCTQTTTIGTLTVDTFFKYTWDCRHQSRWVGTCPCDLMEESGQTTQDDLFVTGGCGQLPLVGTCPCPTTGQPDYYVPACLDGIPNGAISGCVETTSGIICSVPGNNGSIESISGCV